MNKLSKSPNDSDGYDAEIIEDLPEQFDLSRYQKKKAGGGNGTIMSSSVSKITPDLVSYKQASRSLGHNHQQGNEYSTLQPDVTLNTTSNPYTFPHQQQQQPTRSRDNYTDPYYNHQKSLAMNSYNLYPTLQLTNPNSHPHIYQHHTLPSSNNIIKPSAPPTPIIDNPKVISNSYHNISLGKTLFNRKNSNHEHQESYYSTSKSPPLLISTKSLLNDDVDDDNSSKSGYTSKLRTNSESTFTSNNDQDDDNNDVKKKEYYLKGIISKIFNYYLTNNRN
jgi:hypothetical protein